MIDDEFPIASEEICQRLNKVLQGLGQAMNPSETRSITGEWHDEDSIITGHLFIHGTFQRVSFPIDLTDNDAQIAHNMIEAITPLALDRLGKDAWIAAGKSRFAMTRMSNIHRQIIQNAGFNVVDYVERIEGEPFSHHAPPTSDSNFFTLPSVNKDTARLPAAVGNIKFDKCGDMSCTVNIPFGERIPSGDLVQLDITSELTEIRISMSMPETVVASLVGEDLMKVIDIEAMKGIVAKVLKTELSPASQMRPDTHYFQIEDSWDYAAGPIWDEEFERDMKQRLFAWAENKSPKL